MDKITITIDGSDIVAESGATILEAALKNGIYIPHLCYHPDLKTYGACRLCIVEIECGKLVISCRTPVKQGMSVRTRSLEIDKVRRAIIELLIANHHADCRDCTKSRQCELLKIAAFIRFDRKRARRLRWAKEELPRDTSNPFFDMDPNRCVLCGVCVRTCEEIQGVGAIDFVGRGYTSKIAPFGDKPLAQSRCESCGECVVRCPVGALVPKNVQRPEREVKTICSYCGTGCGIYLGIRDNDVVSVRGDTDSPVNGGNLCVKGRFGASFVNSPDRLSSPLIRTAPKEHSEFSTLSLTFPPRGGGQGWGEVSWDEALELVADKLVRYSGDQFALLTSAKCTNEESYVIQKFARVVMNTNNIDNCARLCHAPTMVGLHETMGIGAMTNSISEIEKTSCILAIGTNVTRAHPLIGIKVKRAVRNGAKLIVINPKEIDLCRFADIWLRPYPGTDVALIMGMNQVIVDEGLLDNAFIEKQCENFESLRESLEDFSPGRVERITGVSREMIAQAARIYATNKPAAIIWSTGITQHSHGTDNVFALVNLAMLTGNIGKPSGGLYPLLGENNAQGACDMGCLPDFYPGYQRVTDPGVRKKFETAWSVDLNPEPGLTFTEIWQAILDGKIKAVYIIGANPALSIAGSQRVREALKKAEFVVVQDIFFNETAKFAHVVLPAASFAEKEGTFTNTERRIQRVRKAMEPVGDSRPDWEITCELARRLDGKGFDFSHPAEITSEIASIAPLYGGVSYDRLENESLERFHTPSSKGKFRPLEFRPPTEVPDVEYPLILTTERTLYRHGTLSWKVDGLNILKGKELVEINPKDAADFGISHGQIVRIISRRGEIEAEVKVTYATPPGVISMGFHSTQSPTNVLTNPTLDPVAKTPEAKVCAVRIVPQT
ncbi:MAG: formate dehydrogenase subunit alpha [Actinomycetota bacterium]|nr:formate dehydrogenase subunit alpha [Actinomycetota bacterium]